jgi:hypothetical protein
MDPNATSLLEQDDRKVATETVIMNRTAFERLPDEIIEQYASNLLKAMSVTN